MSTTNVKVSVTYEYATVGSIEIDLPAPPTSDQLAGLISGVLGHAARGIGAVASEIALHQLTTSVDQSDDQSDDQAQGPEGPH